MINPLRVIQDFKWGSRPEPLLYARFCAYLQREGLTAEQARFRLWKYWPLEGLDRRERNHEWATLHFDVEFWMDYPVVMFKQVLRPCDRFYDVVRIMLRSEESRKLPS
jgi:hypothetical protein